MPPPYCATCGIKLPWRNPRLCNECLERYNLEPVACTCDEEHKYCKYREDVHHGTHKCICALNPDDCRADSQEHNCVCLWQASRCLYKYNHECICYKNPGECRAPGSTITLHVRSKPGFRCPPHQNMIVNKQNK